jgi:2-succinyl-5-enolpyruvyl-6-hydroxy-3-cyclohexene-1-carboxylate synthase
VIAQAAHATLWPVPGAVHLNLRARKPLEPRAAVSESERQLEAEVARLLAAPIPRAAPPRLVPDPDAVRVIAGQVRSSRRGIIVCGPMPVSARGGRDALFTLARRTGYPLLVEAASQMRFGVPAGAGDGDRDGALVCDGFDSVLQSPRFRAGARPDLILQLGATPTSTGWSLFSDQHGEVPRVAIGGPGWGDPGGASTLHLIGEVEAALRALVGELAGGAVPADPAWRARFAAGNRAAWDSVRAALAERPGELAEGEVARQVVAALPPGSLLVLGNSLPIRLVDSFAAQQAGDAAVLVQRGANGIDGLVAGAAGAASVADGPVTLLLGDVSLLHDLTSLALARCARANLVVVVIHNGGGRIFEQLPIARSPEVAPEALGHLLTPHQTAFEPAARLFGLDHARPDSRESLGAALAAAHRSGRPTLIEAVVLPHGAAELHQQIWSATDQAVAALLAGTR